jgi:hypothetical protein
MPQEAGIEAVVNVTCKGQIKNYFPGKFEYVCHTVCCHLPHVYDTPLGVSATTASLLTT